MAPICILRDGSDVGANRLLRASGLLLPLSLDHQASPGSGGGSCLSRAGNSDRNCPSTMTGFAAADELKLNDET